MHCFLIFLRGKVSKRAAIHWYLWLCFCICIRSFLRTFKALQLKKLNELTEILQIRGQSYLAVNDSPTTQGVIYGYRKDKDANHLIYIYIWKWCVFCQSLDFIIDIINVWWFWPQRWKAEGLGNNSCSLEPTTLYLHRLMTRSACPLGLAGSRL
jgi:hypothetical protein